MNNECRTMLDKAQAMLTDAKSLDESGQHGDAMKQAYHAAEYVAAVYLSAVKSQSFTPNEATYNLFAKTIREPNRHPEKLQSIKEVVGDLSALREIYEPALLDETTPQDARQMVGHMDTMLELVSKLLSGQ